VVGKPDAQAVIGNYWNFLGRVQAKVKAESAENPTETLNQTLWSRIKTMKIFFNHTTVPTAVPTTNDKMYLLTATDTPTATPTQPSAAPTPSPTSVPTPMHRPANMAVGRSASADSEDMGDVVALAIFQLPPMILAIAFSNACCMLYGCYWFIHTKKVGIESGGQDIKAKDTKRRYQQSSTVTLVGAGTVDTSVESGETAGLILGGSATDYSGVPIVDSDGDSLGGGGDDEFALDSI
jgi:hypothetical protein